MEGLRNVLYLSDNTGTEGLRNVLYISDNTGTEGLRNVLYLSDTGFCRILATCYNLDFQIWKLFQPALVSVINFHIWKSRL